MAQNQKDIEKFDIKVVHDKFEASLQEEDDVDLELYLESFEELNKWELCGAKPVSVFANIFHCLQVL